MNVTSKDDYTLNFKLPGMSDDQFKLFSDFIYKTCGINLLLKKKLMLVARLYKRLNDLNLSSFDEYYNYLLTSKNRDEEIIKMIDAVSTNKTDFFRDPKHFEFLNDKVLPEFIHGENYKNNKIFNIWSAGCSTGEEPYSIALVMSEFFKKNNLGHTFNITGTDISTRVLETAIRGIYKDDVVMPVPKIYLRKYFIHTENKNQIEYHVLPELKKYIIFKRLNLMVSDFKLRKLMDIIFCRNVIIYFDKQTQIELFKKFHANLNLGGYLFIGSSESLHGINDDFHMVAPTIYRKS